MIFEKPLKNYCDEVCLVFFYAQPLSSYCIISLGELTNWQWLGDITEGPKLSISVIVYY